jgi:predicted RNase H-like HicB family nuclease
MTTTTFQTATVATSETSVSLTNSLQPSRQLDLQVWTTVSTEAPSERPQGYRTLIAFPGLRRALHARIYETAIDVAVEDPMTGVFGVGDDLDAAIEDFQAALHDHLEVLASEDALAPPLRRQLELLRGYFSAP